jgi:8-oxo-dGTP diphosphatase
MTFEGSEFRGAKLALLVGDRVLVLRRDDIPSIPFPGHWDLPGGGREGDESPEACLRRELAEELGVTLPPTPLGYGRAWPNWAGAVEPDWFFVHRDDGFDAGRVRLGDEGTGWELMQVATFLANPRSVPHLARRLAVYLGR